MTDPHRAFELVLTGGVVPHWFTACVPDGNGGRAAEQVFDWCADTEVLLAAEYVLECDHAFGQLGRAYQCV